MDIVIALVVATIMIALGLLALAQDVRKLYSILFFALTITLSGWIISSALTNHYFGDSQLIINIISNRLAYFFWVC
jgi:hypothetical protein